jgi:hypothetical protein
MEHSRRRFISVVGKGLCGAAVFSLIPSVALAENAPQGLIRIQAIPGRDYPEGFLRFISKAVFASPADAVASIRDKRLAYNLVWSQ